MEEHRNSRNFYGIITSGKGKSGCNASLDEMPAEYKKVHAKRRIMFPVADPEEEEQEHDHFAEECEKIEDIEQTKWKKENFNDIIVLSVGRTNVWMVP